MTDSLRGILPPVYRPLFDPFFDRPKVVETRATCDKCAMCDHGTPSPVPMDYFRPDTKCCTFHPQLPNYLVGAILADPSPEMEEGKRRVREQIKLRFGATPHWLNRPRKMSLILLGYSEGFGRAKSLLCPYFNVDDPAASCTIWRHRETVCLTYYCKYSAGKRGFDFWIAFKNYLAHVQRRLVKFAADAVDPAVVEPVFKKNALTLEDIEDLPPKDSDYTAWWKSWVGREEEFYVRCYEWVKSIPQRQFALNIDETEAGKACLTDLVAKYEKLQNRILPSRLVRNARMSEQHVGDKVVVTTYHRYDSFALDKDLYDVVGMFRANESLEENLARLAADGIELAPELIEFLYVAGVLVEPGGTPTGDEKKDAALEAKRLALAAVVRARKIAIDAPALERIAKADLDALETLIMRAATATTAAEIFAEGEPSPT
jgi:hypothetical protein